MFNSEKNNVFEDSNTSLENPNNNRKRLIIIVSIVLVLLILISIIIGVNLKKKKPNGKVSGKVTDSSLFDSSSQDDSTIDDSSSQIDIPLGSSLTDSSETDSSSNTDSSSVASTEKGNTGGNTSTGGTTGGKTGGGTSGGGTTGGGTSGGGTSGGGSTNHTPTTMTFTVTSFTPLAEINYNIGLGKPVFEYIYGVQRNEGGIPTKYIQQYDKVTLQTNMPVTSVEVSENLILESFSGNTINIRAKGNSSAIEIWDNEYIIVNGNPNYRYNFRIRGYANYSYQGHVNTVSVLYWESMGNIAKKLYDPTLVGYTGGDQSKSITGRTIYKDNLWYDDWIDMNGQSLYKSIKLLEEYKRRGYKYLNINVTEDGKALIYLAFK